MTAENFVNISGGNVQGFIQENHGTVTQNFIYQVSELISGQTSGTEQPLTQVEYRQRTVLLSKVKEYWIEGVLNKSLHTKAMIELGLEKRSDAVERPFSSFEELPEESKQILPTGTDATEVFNQTGEGRTLLILGEPGAGKTITLLKLAQNLIARAEGGLSRLIPVVLNLSSWGSKQQTIADWLVQELWSKYQVPKEVGKDWVKNQKLLLLLDGLDEVKANRREACVEAINQFMQKYGQTEMVVCSRIADYQVLSNRLQLRGAIYIRSLTPEQVNQYLDNAGEQLGAVKTLLTEDTTLQELAKSPLTLSIMTLAYQGKKVEEILQTGSVEARREHLFDAYIKRMFSHEKSGKPKEYKSPYQNQQAKSWLTWLAQRMKQESESVFLIEQMQPTWLQTKAQNRLYRFGSMLVGGLLIVLILWPIYAWDPLFNSFPFPKGQLINALRWGVLLGLIFGWGKAEIKTFETLTWPWKKTRKDLFDGLISGLKWGLLFSLVLGPIYGFLRGSEGSPFYLGTVFANYGTELPGLKWGIGYGLSLGMSLGLTFGLINAIKGSEIETKTIPNQGIWRSAMNVGVTGLIAWLIFVPTYWFNRLLIIIFYKGLIFNVSAWGESSLFDLITPGLRWGLLLGLIFGGGLACIRHFTLRFILHRNNYIPWNYARFLDYASDRIFLQKVGGGYIFVHRMLLEHFARMK
ncbi:NACHT domain-containing protein [Microcystis wesenbergii FACHB-1317]|uniref:NACHT domain-containing protein n=1 Tax=Microcystis TaxID=1125 RepID=UPI0016818C8F|nr:MULTISPECIES: NACHT domain-containing protein [Microcystis]MBD2291748.1 NACHT domain-containing protein [Microcystis wesenbergii FACHB-1317]UZO75155.1 NACHT domain-containing protein [Microcystis aeruginosa str. Chao 1910]